MRPTVDGDQFAFLQGANSSVRLELTGLAEGLYRVRYKAAARVNSGGDPEETAIEVNVGPTLTDLRTVAIELPRHMLFQEYDSVVFKVEAGENLNVRFRKHAAALGAGNHVAFIDAVRLERVSEWDDAASWTLTSGFDPDGIPDGDDDVTILAGHAVGLDGTHAADEVSCGGDVLALDDGVSVELEARTVMVAGEPVSGRTYGARLEVGREELRFASDFELRLVGPYDPNPDGMNGTKFLMAMDSGTIDMHGLEKTSWSHLRKTVPAGALGILQRIEVTESELWGDGDVLCLTASVFNRSGLGLGAGALPDYDLTTSAYVLTDYTSRLEVEGSPAGGIVDLDMSSASMLPLMNNPDALGALFQGRESSNPLVSDSGRTVIGPFQDPRAAVGEYLLRDSSVEGDEHGPAPQPTIELDQSVEVGNLTRNVRITSDANVPLDYQNPDDSDPLSQFGGHVMVMKEACCAVGGTGRFSHVELSKMGIAKRPGLGEHDGLGTYPVHFHLLGDEGARSFVHGCSIHESFNRGITIHGSNEVSVMNNVTYRCLGHTIFLEDGSEMRNVIDGNLVMAALRPHKDRAPIRSDSSPTDRNAANNDNFRNRAPAAFWITNPFNTVTNNVAAGSFQGTGFWMAFVREPMGLSALDPVLSNVAPALRMPFQTDPYTGRSLFRDNRVHACKLGLHFNDSVEADGPDEDTSMPSDGFVDNTDSRNIGVRRNTSWIPSRVQDSSIDEDDESAARDPSYEVVDGFTAYGCDGGIYTSTGTDQLVLRRCVIADCNRATDFASYAKVEDSWFLDTGGMQWIPAVPPNALRRNTVAMVYDGAARFDEVMIVTTDFGFETVVQLRGAATLHPNVLFENVHHVDLTGPSGPEVTQPRLLLNLYSWTDNGGLSPFPGLDYNATTETIRIQRPLDPSGVELPPLDVAFWGSGTEQNLGAPSKWGLVLLDQFQRLNAPNGPASAPARSIVSGHPWNLTFVPDATDPSGFRAQEPVYGGIPATYPVPAGESKVDALFVSDRHFGHLRVAHFDLADGKRNESRHCFSDDTSTIEQHFNWRILRSPRPVTGSPELDVVFQNHFAARDRRQLPLIVAGPGEEPFYIYDLSHEDTPFRNDNDQFEIVIDDVLAGSSAFFFLRDLNGFDPDQVSATMTNNDGSAVALLETDDQAVALAHPESCLFHEGATTRWHLYLRVRDAGPDGSLPAGRPQHGTNDERYVGSVNHPDSKWRREAIRIQW
ncbi:MAG: G8 domain-containing protein [Planctomycetota bacterium]